MRIWLARKDTILRLMRYATVSVVSTATSLATLGALVGVVGMPATSANVIATAVGTAPSFELNRRWVWSDDGRRSLVRQVMPFCALSFTGLVVSTLAVGVVAGHTAGWGHWSRTAAVLGANLTAYGTLWVIQFQLLDRFLFHGGAVRSDPIQAGEPPSAVHREESTTSADPHLRFGDVLRVGGAPAAEGTVTVGSVTVATTPVGASPGP